ncbi:hypothetical protein HPB48_003637 [Haemaphysalis longicornis]|uniref:DDE-1 domain-containing protein n=1 Tax=Haemaphysalis longicornis TaxID=44386 RepID=A0A9J6FFU6_HAELO|nr:hypothetical protein HPB48_003637 [Haemaphysalis longicornis]
MNAEPSGASAGLLGCATPLGSVIVQGGPPAMAIDGQVNGWRRDVGWNDGLCPTLPAQVAFPNLVAGKTGKTRFSRLLPNGLLHRFKVRHGIVFKLIVGKAASASDQYVAAWLEKNEEVISSYAERGVYNADETALYYQMLPDKTHAMKDDTCTGGKHSKVRVKALVCTNMDGSDRRVPFVIRKSKKPRWFRSYVPVRYRHNDKPWMMRDLFADWLSEFDRDMQRQGRRVPLGMDNCSAHDVQT